MHCTVERRYRNGKMIADRDAFGMLRPRTLSKGNIDTYDDYARLSSSTGRDINPLLEVKLINIGNEFFVLRGFEQVGDKTFLQEWICRPIK